MRFFKGRRKLYLVAVLAILLSFLLVHIVQAVTTAPAEPGSDGDPLITQSYVDSKVNTLNSSISEMQLKLGELMMSRDNLTKSIDQLTAAVAELNVKAGGSPSPATSTDLGKKVEVLAAKVAELEKTVKGSDVQTPGSTAGLPHYAIVTLPKGKKLIPKLDTEIIVRIGTVKAVKGQYGNLLDITQGTETSTSGNLPKNHLLLAHMEDGRGISAVVDSKVAVKGAYTIK